jgi:hypothetical protein
MDENNETHIVVGILVDDTKEITIYFDSKREKVYDLAYEIVGVKILNLSNMTVGNISLSDFLRNDSIYDKLYSLTNEQLLATDSKYRAVILKDNFGMIKFVDRLGVAVAYEVGCNIYNEFVFNTFDKQISKNKNRVIALGEESIELLGTIIIVYDFDSGSIGMYLKVPGEEAFYREIWDLLDNKKSLTYDVIMGAWNGGTVLDLNGLVKDYIIDSGYASGIGNGLYFVSKPNDVILLPSDCKYFVSYCLDFNTVAVKSIVIPPSCEFAVIDPLEYLGQKCKIYISRDSDIDVGSIIVDSDDRDMFDIEYY